METYRFHWEKYDELGLTSKGNFTVTAMTFEKCMESAEEEIKNHNAVLTDWHIA